MTIEPSPALADPVPLIVRLARHFPGEQVGRVHALGLQPA